MRSSSPLHSHLVHEPEVGSGELVSGEGSEDGAGGVAGSEAELVDATSGHLEGSVSSEGKVALGDEGGGGDLTGIFNLQ